MESVPPTVEAESEAPAENVPLAEAGTILATGSETLLTTGIDASPPEIGTENASFVPVVEMPPPVIGMETAAPKVRIFMPLAACVAGAIFPGLGHVVLRKWDRALVFLGSITLMFMLGLSLDGRLFSPDFSDLFSSLKFIADAGTGSMYWICRLRGMGIGDPAIYTYDFGNVFIYTAGLLNMLVIVDAFDIAVGRKP